MASIAPPVEKQSLPEVAGSISVPVNGSWKTMLLRFGGPAFLVSVGYMDPGNWGTDLAGGSQFGYKLLWVILASNLMAQVLQVLCARLGLVTGMDLARACREYYKRPAAYALWFLCEIAIIATDLAEVVGSAIAINLLFPSISLTWGVLITGADVLLLLALMRFGFRKIEAIVIMLVATIGVCFAYQMFLSHPNVGSIVKGTFMPTIPNQEALIIALGILGATVMPHNLYLHSAIVQTREAPDLKKAIKYNTVDTIVALSAAFFVNAGILILAAAVFHGGGKVEDLSEGHKLLAGSLGGASAAAFAIALLCSGQSSTITGTLAGQVVMEGFLRVRIKPWVRRLVTRLLAIIPALFIITATGGSETVLLLVISQCVLSIQLPFAILPLVMITSNKKLMGDYANPMWLKLIGYVICVLIIGLNIVAMPPLANKLAQLPENDPFGKYFLATVVTVVTAFALWVKFGYQERVSRVDG